MTGRYDADPAILRDLLAPLGEVETLESLGGGLFATAVCATFADGSRSVVKMVAADTGRMSTYEKGILGTEARIFGMLAGSGVPVPRVQLTDFTRTRLAADVVVTEHLPGAVWNDLSLDDDAQHALRRELGAVMASAHRVTAPYFGYPAPESGLSGATWREAFGRMVDAVLADGEHWDVALPGDRVRAAMAAHATQLDEVVSPAVVHADLWAGNVFVDEGALRIVGIIDTERTVWADPLLDLAGAEQFSAAPPDPDILAGDAAAGGVLTDLLATEAGQARLQLCRMYYSLLLVTEVTIRAYEGEYAIWCETTARANLDVALDRLGC
ncbi:phosphotransferase [Microbacterium sp. LWO13-1.2]|uniref:phosphotransferase family protein n=1 Tax=Microbacterium sp. LWO13-1.2 TaxID=3135262 RepID=UPI003139F964